MLAVKPFRQRPVHCGPSCLKMVLAFFGVVKTEKELSRITQTSQALGTSAENIVAAAKLLGFLAWYKDDATLADIKRYVKGKKIPVIVNWFSEDCGHYSVVVDIDTENIYLQDPEIGQIRALRLADFRRVWFDWHGDYLKSKDDIILRRLIVVESS